VSGSYIYRMPRQRLVLPHEPAQTYVRIMREQDERAARIFAERARAEKKSRRKP